MGKIVKYCSSCDEGFAERFGFCPDCGSPLQSFEMKPIVETQVEAAPVVDPPVTEFQAVEPAAPAFIEPEPLITEPFHEPVVKFAPVTVVDTTPEPVVAEEPIIKAAPETVIETIPEPVTAFEPAIASAPETVIETMHEPISVAKPDSVEAAKASRPTPEVPVFTSPTAYDVDHVSIPKDFEAEHSRALREGGFYVTVIQEKNAGTRNSLLLGTFVFMICALLTGLVYNIFSKDLDIGAINDNLFDAVIAETTPMTVEEEKVKKEKDQGGGGGGGGKQEKDPASQGDLADQSKTPTRPPDVNTPRSDTPMLQPPQTEGTMKFPKIYGKWGDPNGAPGLSNGPGSGGGIGSGRGPGQGGGNGTGAGNGNGSGFGNGDGNGNGNGIGDGDAPPPRAVGVTQGIKIISKPKPSYTDAARQNQVQGTVILRVTFLASGAIGSISPVKGLPNGLTEQAIAAARSMRFEPAKVNGAGVTVTKQVEYTFSIY